MTGTVARGSVRSQSYHVCIIATPPMPTSISKRPLTTAAAGLRSPSRFAGSSRDSHQAANERAVRVYSAGASIVGRGGRWAHLRLKSTTPTLGIYPRQQKQQRGDYKASRGQCYQLPWPSDDLQTQIDSAEKVDKCSSDWRRQAPFRPLSADGTANRLARLTPGFPGHWGEGEECGRGHNMLLHNRSPLEQRRRNPWREGVRAQSAKLPANHCHILKETAATAQRVRLLELQRLAKEKGELETQLAEVKMLTKIVMAGKMYGEAAMAGVLSERLHPTHCNSGRLLLRRKKNKYLSTAPYMRASHKITTGAKGSFPPRDSGDASFYVARRLDSSACQADRVHSTAARAKSRTRRRSRRVERVHGQIRKSRTREEPGQRANGTTREHTEGTFGPCTTKDHPLSTEEKSCSVRGSTEVDVRMKSQQKLFNETRITPTTHSTVSGVLAYPIVPSDSRKGEGATCSPTNRWCANNADVPRNLVSNWSTSGSQTDLGSYRESSMSRQKECGSTKLPGGNGSRTAEEKQTHASRSNIASKTISAVAVSTPVDDNHGPLKGADQEYNDDFEAISVHDSRGGSDSRPGDELHTPQDRLYNQGSVEDKNQLEEKSSEQCFVTESGPDIEIEEWDEWRSSQDGAEAVSQELQGKLTTGQKWGEGRQAIQNGTRGKEPDGPSRRRWNQDEDCRLLSDEQGSREQTFGPSDINTNLDEVCVPISDGHKFSRTGSWAVDSSCNDKHGGGNYCSVYDENSVLRTSAGFPSRQPDREDVEVPSHSNAYAKEVISDAMSAEGGWSLCSVQFPGGSTPSLAGQRVSALNERATTGAFDNNTRDIYRSEGHDCGKVISSSKGSFFYYSTSPPLQNDRSEEIIVTRKLSSFVQRRQNKNTNVSMVQDPIWGITAPCSSSALTFDQAQSEVQAFRSSGKIDETEIDDAYDETLVLNIENNLRRRDDLYHRRPFGESFTHERHRDHGTSDVSVSDTLGENIVVNDTDHDNSVCADGDGRYISSGSNGSIRQKHLWSFDALQSRPAGKPCQEFSVESALFTREKEVENTSSDTGHAGRDKTLDDGVGFYEKRPFDELTSGSREVLSESVDEDFLAVPETHGTGDIDVDRSGDGGRGSSTKNAKLKPQRPSNELISRSARKQRRDLCAGTTPNSSSPCIARAVAREDPSDGGYNKGDSSIEGAAIDDEGSFDELILADERPSDAIGDTSLIIEKEDGNYKRYCGESGWGGPVETTRRGYRGPSNILRSKAEEIFCRESRDGRTPDAPATGASARAPIHADGDIGSDSAKRLGHDNEVSTAEEPHGVPASGGVHIIKNALRCEDALVGCSGSPTCNAVQDHQRSSNGLQFCFAQKLYQESCNRGIPVGAVKVASYCAPDVGDGSQGHGRVERGGRTDQGSLELTFTDQPYRSPFDEDVFTVKEQFHGVDVPDSSAATSENKGLSGKAEQNHRGSSSELRSWSADKLREGLLNEKLPFAGVEAKSVMVSGLEEGSCKQTSVETPEYDEKESFKKLELEYGSLLNSADEQILAVEKEIVCDGAFGKTVSDGQDDRTGSGGLQQRQPSDQLWSRSMGRPRRTSRNGGARIAQAGGFTDGKASGQAGSRRRHIFVHKMELNDEGSFDELSSADVTPGDPVSEAEGSGETAVGFSGSSGCGGFAGSIRQGSRGLSKEQQVQPRSGVNPLEESRFGSALVDRAEIPRSPDTPRLGSDHYREGDIYDSRGSFNDLRSVHRTPSNLIDHDVRIVAEGIRAHPTRACRARENGHSQITERLGRYRTQSSEELRHQVESYPSRESRKGGTPGTPRVDTGGADATSHTGRDGSSSIVEEVFGQKSTSSEDVFDPDLIGKDHRIIAEDKCDGSAALVDAEGGRWDSLISEPRPNPRHKVVAEEKKSLNSASTASTRRVCTVFAWQVSLMHDESTDDISSAKELSRSLSKLNVFTAEADGTGEKVRGGVTEHIPGVHCEKYNKILLEGISLGDEWNKSLIDKASPCGNLRDKGVHAEDLLGEGSPDGQLIKSEGRDVRTSNGEKLDAYRDNCESLHGHSSDGGEGSRGSVRSGFEVKTKVKRDESFDELGSLSSTDRAPYGDPADHGVLFVDAAKTSGIEVSKSSERPLEGSFEEDTYGKIKESSLAVEPATFSEKEATVVDKEEGSFDEYISDLKSPDSRSDHDGSFKPFGESLFEEGSSDYLSAEELTLGGSNESFLDENSLSGMS